MRTIFLVFLSMVTLASCERFLFGNSRAIGGDYRLVQWTDHKTYKLQDTAQPENVSANSGAIVRIGWDPHHILVRREESARSIPVPNGAGWVVIDIDQKSVSEPLTDAEIQKRPDLAHIVTYSPDSAWSKL